MLAAELQELLYEELGYREVETFSTYNSDQRLIYPLPDVEQVYYIKGVPVAYFSRLEATDPDRLLNLHRSVWNESRVPLLYVVLPNEIRIYNTYADPAQNVQELDQPSRLLEHLTGLVEVETVRQQIRQYLNTSQHNYSRLYLETGAFWATPDGLKIRRESRADQRLLASIQGACDYLTQRGLDSEMAFGLVGRSIFIRYLEDRQLLTSSQIAAWTGGRANSYQEALENKNTAYQLFKGLNAQYNGDMFPPDTREESRIEDQHLEGLRLFLSGYNFDTGQTSFWPYDFRFVPKELISGIYERVIENRRESGTYYTPLPLADFLVEETMPLTRTKPSMTVLDPACGSGVFLVRAYQRLIESWIETNDRRPNAAELIKLLQDRIFGIDIQAKAVQIAAFSLYLALLDNLDNEAINQAHFRFPLLKKHNLFIGDFLADETREWLDGRQFDRVIGNPPWGRGTLTKQAAKRTKEVGLEAGGEQLVHAFLAVAPSYCAVGGEVALLAPAKSTIHVTSTTLETFRFQFFEQFGVRAVVNFSAMRRELFDAAISPLVALFYAPTPARTDKLVYCIPKPSLLSQRLKAIVLDNDQIKYLDRRELMAFPDLWKIAAWGTPLDAAFIKRLKALPNLKQMENSGWKIKEGFIGEYVGSDKNRAEWLTDQPFLDTTGFKPFISEPTGIVEQEFFHRPRTAEIYNAPLVLIKRSHCEATYFRAGVITYRNKITGVVAHLGDEKLLKWLVTYINSPLAKYYHFLTSHSWAIERDAIMHEEYRGMPFPIPGEEKLSQIVSHFDRLAELLKGFFPDRRVLEVEKAALNELVYEVFEVIPSERQLVEDTLDYTIPFFEWFSRKNRKPNEIDAVRQPTSSIMEAYAQSFTETVRHLLRYQERTLNAKVYRDGAPLSVTEFTTVNQSASESVQVVDSSKELRNKLKSLDKLLVEQQTETLYIQRQVRIYEGDKFYLVRPSEQRFWTRSQAIIDASDFISEQLTASVTRLGTAEVTVE